jgi:hypothetical protein
MIQDNPVGVRTAQESEVDHLASGSMAGKMPTPIFFRRSFAGYALWKACKRDCEPHCPMFVW